MPFKKGEKAKGSTQFKKGQTGNPKGRPKVIPELRELMANVLSEEKDGINAAEAILKSMRTKAIKGDVKAAEFIYGYAYGKASQSIDFTTKGEKLETVIMWGDREIKI